MNDDRYYLLYDDRYQRMHSRGFERWVSSPEESAGVIDAVDIFLDYAGVTPGDTSIIEFGCGEGFIAEHLLSLGYDYLGLDISEAAIEKSKKHAGTGNDKAFMQADILTDLHRIANASYEIAIDNQCLHMLVTDEHRWKYLDDMRRILKPGGKAFFRENLQEQEFTDSIRDYDEWLKKTGNDYSTLHDYPAYKGDRRYTVKVPRVPARFNNEAGYRRELGEARLKVEFFESDGYTCVIYAGGY